MTDVELEKLRDENEKAQQAQMAADATGEKTTESVVEKTPEQLAVEAKQTEMKVRQNLVVAACVDLVEQLVNNTNDFTAGELGWAVDAFKTKLELKVIQTVEHEAFYQESIDRQEKFYSTKMKDLTPIPDEVSSPKVEAASAESSTATV